MNPEILAAFQRALDAQFQAGKTIGALELLITQSTKTEVVEAPPEAPDAP